MSDSMESRKAIKRRRLLKMGATAMAAGLAGCTSAAAPPVEEVSVTTNTFQGSGVFSNGRILKTWVEDGADCLECSDRPMAKFGLDIELQDSEATIIVDKPMCGDPRRMAEEKTVQAGSELSTFTFEELWGVWPFFDVSAQSNDGDWLHRVRLWPMKNGERLETPKEISNDDCGWPGETQTPREVRDGK